MLHPNSKIQWMDVNSQLVYSRSVYELFQMYSHKMIQKTPNVLEISFDPEKDIVKTRDWVGWTDIRIIRKHLDIIPAEWVNIQIAQHQITVSAHTIIPIYNPNKIISGFHGETKHDYTVKYASEVNYGDIIRARNIQNDDGIKTEFAHIHSITIDTIGSKMNGYDIITKSEFFNVGNIYISCKEMER